MQYKAVDTSEVESPDEPPVAASPEPANAHTWRKNVKLGFVAASVIFAINLAWLIWAVAATASDGTPGVRFIFSGPCSRTRNINLWTHLAINIASSTLLAAGNNCMQCLTAPTRHDIDHSHAKYRWLDVGVHTLRNLRAVSPQRRIIWLLLALTSLPVHLLYNSVVFEAKVVNAYGVVAASPAFVTGGFWNRTRAKCFNNEGFDPTTLISWLQHESNTLAYLDNTACIKAYGKSLVSDWGNVILVTNASTSDSVLNFGLEVFQSPGNYDGADSFLCGTSHGSQSCESLPDAANWTILGSANPGITDYNGELPFTSPNCEMLPNVTFQIDHCLAQKTAEACRVGIAPGLLGAVIVCNFIKAVCLFWTFHRLRFEPLVTLGDTIASFLRRPDPSTVGCGAMAANDVKQWTPSMDRAHGFVWKARMTTGYVATSLLRWIVCILLFGLFWVLALALLLRVGLEQFRNDAIPTTLRSLAANGIGHLNIDDMVYWLPQGILGNVILANTPQLLLSLLYLLYNDLFTRIHLSAQWTSYSRVRQPLRVLHPNKGAGAGPEHRQKSHYILSLPLRIGIPLLVVITVLHWLVSQSIFFAMIGVNDYTSPDAPNPKPVDGGYPVLGCGWSPFALVLTLILGGMMIVGLVVTAALFRYGKSMPIARSCSAAISAACHPGEQDTNAELKLLMYGVIEEGVFSDTEGIKIPGRVGFTPGPVTPLINGEVYR